MQVEIVLAPLAPRYLPLPSVRLRISKRLTFHSMHHKPSGKTMDNGHWQPSRSGLRVFTVCICWLIASAGLAQNIRPADGWRASLPEQMQIDKVDATSWKITSHAASEFTIESQQSLACRPGDGFAVNVNIRVDLSTKALPELACYDAAGKEIPSPSSLEGGPRYFTTNWQELRRVFLAQPGTASVRARVRGSGKGLIELADLQFYPQKIDPYETGALVTQLHASLRNGVVLESNFGVVNADALSKEDRDGDGKWALISVDLDRLTEPSQKGSDWRSNFEGNPNAILWSDGAVLKSDSVSEDRNPDRANALHFRMQGRRGPYRAWMNDPGRAIAWSRDGSTWQRHAAGQEVDLGVFPGDDGVIEFWIDACYRDSISTGPAYFDYVRLHPIDDPAAIERLFEAARWKSTIPDRGSVDERAVNVTVSAPPFAHGSNWPVRCGLPIPQGELATASHVEVRNSAGKTIPSQCRVTARWPDGSAKWLFLDFFHDLSSQGDATYAVVYGNRVQASEGAQGVRTLPTEAGLTVDTGAIRFTVPKGRFGLIEDVQLSSGESLQREPINVEIAEQAGKVWSALDLPVVKLQVEQAGPLHTVILAETQFAESGRPASGFAHRARIHAYANSPLVEIDYFVANTDSRAGAIVEGSMSSKVLVKSVALKITPQQLITESLHSYGAMSVPGAVIQASADKAIIETAAGTSEEQRRAVGSVALELAGNRTLSIGVTAFAEQFPKAFRWTREALEVDLWAEEGGDFDWIEGVGKTHHVALYYGAGKPASTTLLAKLPVLAVAPPRWYADSGAMGPLTPVATSCLPVVENTLARHVNEAVIERVGLGFENYGDHSSGGYVKGTFLWDNNEYDLPAGCMVHFARTGDRQALDLGLASALHYLDVDTVHYSSQHADWARAQHVHSHGTFGHHTAQGPDMHHAGYVQGLIWYTYFTGDPAGIEGAKGIADWVLRNSKIHVTGMERALGHPLTTLNDVYEATGDEKYLKSAARLVDQAIQWEHPLRSGFLAPITESPAYYSGSPFCGGLLPSAVLKFNSWASQPDIDAMLQRVARWTLTDVWRPPANIFTKGGSPRRGGDGQQIASHLRLMDYVFARTGDPLFLVVPRECIVRGFGENAKSIGTRSTGLVLNNVPWFLTTLEGGGDPQPDPRLELLAPAAEIPVTLGNEFSVVLKLTNTGSTPIMDLRASFQSRIDFRTIHQSQLPKSIGPGQTVELTYKVEAPSQVNLQCLYNRIAYAHWSALYRRDEKVHLAHTSVAISLED